MLPLSLLPKSEPFPFMFRFDGNGEVLETLQASQTAGLPSFSCVVQVDEYLLMGTPGGMRAIDACEVYRVPLSKP